MNFSSNNQDNDKSSEKMVIYDKRPGKGRLIPLIPWCEDHGISLKEVKIWSLKYSFYIKKVGRVEYVAEKDLENALQQLIVEQEAIIEERRSRARNAAELRRTLMSGYLESLSNKIAKLLGMGV